jgi:hypothetical protein
MNDIWKALVGFLFGLLAFGIQRIVSREKRALTAYTTTFSLLSLPDVIREQVKVTFAGDRVDNIVTHTITIVNSGNTTVLGHELTIRVEGDSRILHVAVPARVSIAQESTNVTKLLFPFVNKRQIMEIRVTTAGSQADNLLLDGEGPGVDFDAPKRRLPILHANMSQQELWKALRRLMFGQMLRQLPWLILIYGIAIGLVFLVLYLTEKT